MLIDVSTVDGQRKAPVNGNLKEPVVSQLAAHVTTAATSAGAIASQTAQQITALQDTFSWLKWVLGGLTLGAVVLGVVAKLSADAKDAADKGNATASVDLEADAGLPTATAPEVTSPPPAAPEAQAAPAKGA
jgi:hypothetical protein